VEEKGLHESAHKCRTLAGEAVRYGIATGQAETDPATMLRGALKPMNSKTMAFLSAPAEVGALLRAMRGYTGGPAAYAALNVAPYVFVRPGELRAAEWSEFELDGDEPAWVIPAARMKARRPHVVPLAPQVVALLVELHKLTGGGRYVFPCERTPARCMSENTLNACLRRLGYSSEQVQAHGFRHMASTLLNELGWDADLIELQLAHADRNAIRAVYCKAEKIADRRRMLAAWADYLDNLRDGAQVIPFRRGAA